MSFTETVNKTEMPRPRWSVPTLGKEETMRASRKLQRRKQMYYTALTLPLYRATTVACSKLKCRTHNQAVAMEVLSWSLHAWKAEEGGAQVQPILWHTVKQDSSEKQHWLCEHICPFPLFTSFIMFLKNNYCKQPFKNSQPQRHICSLKMMFCWYRKGLLYN